MGSFAKCLLWLAGVSAAWAQIPRPTDVPDDLLDSILSGSAGCSTKSGDCMANIWSLTDPPNCPTNHCLCAALQTEEYRDCVKEQCPDDWEEYLEKHVANFCEILGVDVDSLPTHTFTQPSGSSATGLVDLGGGDDDDGGLDNSDKIAIGIGVGLGVPTLAVTVFAWLCARPRWKAWRAKEKGQAGLENGEAIG